MEFVARARSIRGGLAACLLAVCASASLAAEAPEAPEAGAAAAPAVQAAPGPFSKVAPSNGQFGFGGILSWTASAVATGYEYCYDTSNDNSCSAWISAGNVTSVVLNLPAPMTTYYWNVRAINGVGATYSTNGAPPGFWSFNTGGLTKMAPASGSAGHGTSVTLIVASRLAPTTTYEFCYDTSNDSACASWIPAANSWMTLSGLAPGTTYYWHARAMSAGGILYSDGSDTAFSSFSTQGGPPASFSMSYPANGQPGVPTALTLYWGQQLTGTTVEYCLDTTNDNACVNWVAGGAYGIDVSGLLGGTSYYWSVRASNALGTTYANDGQFWRFTTAVPGALTKITPADGATGVWRWPILKWGAMAGASAYEYCYDTTDDGVCGSWTMTNFTSTGGLPAAPGTTYYWQVRAIGPGGLVYADGAEASSWRFTTQPDGTFGKLAPANGAGLVSGAPTLRWSPSAGAAAYEYCLDTNSGPCVDWIDVGSSTSAVPVGLQAGATYFWMVRAVHAGGNIFADEPVAQWAFTTAAIPKVDFNSDGKIDLLFQSSSGALYAWFMDTSIRIGGGFLSQSPIDPNLRVVGVNDFTGDGKPDLLLQHQTNGAVTLHIMDGLSKVGEQSIPIAANTPWKVVATGDVDRDGYADIMWQHDVLGQFYVWFMAPKNGWAGYGGPGGAFAGDYLRDLAGAIVATPLRGVGGGERGNGADLVLRSVETGALGLWYFDSPGVGATVSLAPAAVNPVWEIRAVADYSGDGRPDIVWQHVSSGELYYWQMNGTQLGAHGYLSSIAVNPIWTIVGPR